jgi:4-hydroxybenzoate polyprenyltransferase
MSQKTTHLMAYWHLMRLDKPIGIYLLLHPTLWAFFLAGGGARDLKTLLIFVLGVVLMRSAGCVINDIADRDIDKLVARTKDRPITTGVISVRHAMYLFTGLVFLAFLLVLLTNTLTIQLAVVAIILATLYPFTKRWTNLPQFVLGLAFSMSIPMAFAALNGFVPTQAWWIFLANVIWTLIYDTLYAMSDREEDLKIGVKSTAILFAQYDKWIIGILQGCLLGVLLQIGSVFNLDFGYFLSILVASICMGYHQFLIKNREKTACFKAFLHNHYLGLAVLLGIVFDKV